MKQNTLVKLYLRNENETEWSIVSSPDSLFVFGWGGSLVDRANIFVPALECRSQVLVCRFGGVGIMNFIKGNMNIITTVSAWRVIPRRSAAVVPLTYLYHQRIKF